MALMGVIIHAVGSICSSSALESPAGFKKTPGRDTCPDPCVYAEPITCLRFHGTHEHVQSHVYSQSVNLNAAFLITMA